MSFNTIFDKAVGRIDRVRLGPKEDFNFRFLRPLKGDYVDKDGNVFDAQETLDAGYEPFDEPVCSSVVPYGNNGVFANVGNPIGSVGQFVDVGVLGLNGAINVPVEYPLDIIAPDGSTYGVILEATRLTNGGTPSFNSAGGGISSAGGHDYRYRLLAQPDVLGNVPVLRWNVRPSSLNVGGEQFLIQAQDTYPTDFINGGQSNASQADWDNQTGIFANGATFVFSNINNASNVSAFEFTGSEVSFRANSQSGVGMGLNIYLMEGPSYDICLCDRMEAVEDAIENPDPRPVNVPFLQTVFFDTLNSAVQDVNDATRVYTWQGVTTSTVVTKDATNDRFTASQVCTVQITPRLRVINATANDRAKWIGDVVIEDAGGAELRRYGIGSDYIRDVNAAYDKGEVSGSVTASMNAGERFYVETTRLSSQDPNDDNPASQALSNLRIELYT